LAVLTPFNAPKVTVGGGTSPAMRVPTVLQNADVHYNGQPIGVVVADTFEHALEGVQLVAVKYAPERAVLDMSTAPKNPPESVHPLGGERTVKRGDPAGAFAAAAVMVDREYNTAFEKQY